MAVYYDEARDGQMTLYAVLNRTENTNLLALIIQPRGNFVRLEPHKLKSCAHYIRLTQYFLIYSCPEYADEGLDNQGKIYVSLRSTYETIFEIAGSGSRARFGTDIQVIESQDGL